MMRRKSRYDSLMAQVQEHYPNYDLATQEANEAITSNNTAPTVIETARLLKLLLLERADAEEGEELKWVRRTREYILAGLQPQATPMVVHSKPTEYQRLQARDKEFDNTIEQLKAEVKVLRVDSFPPLPNNAISMVSHQVPIRSRRIIHNLVVDLTGQEGARSRPGPCRYWVQRRLAARGPSNAYRWSMAQRRG
ncbi:hypothetical protein HDU76_003529 [Blyttiomyces sp. JEL0837]|nr:hypothetical protein HDU76_003529 [Blyttiomyces sp. JEL0837]